MRVSSLLSAGSLPTAAARRLLGSRPLLGAAGTALVIGAWWALTSGLRLINPQFLPDPKAVLMAMIHLLTTGPIVGDGGGYGGVNLLGHALTSAYRVLLGFADVIVISLPLGFLMAAVPAAERLLNPIVQLLRPIPPIAWTPLAILWFGIGTEAVLFTITIGVVWPLIISTVAGVASASKMLVRAAATLGASQFQIYTRVIIPASMPYLFTGLRLAFGMAWWMIIPAELIAAQRGLGFLILRAQDNQNTADVIVGILAIAVVGFGFDWLFRCLQRWRYFSVQGSGSS
jgi:NitT/TauT family transport system permease protein